MWEISLLGSQNHSRHLLQRIAGIRTARNCDFYSILRAPNTVGVVHLLKDKANKLQETISKISAFYFYDEEVDEDMRVDM